MAESEPSATSSIRVAGAFIGAVREANFDLAWALATPELRIELAEAWLTANVNHIVLFGRERPDLLRDLMDKDSRLWEGFAGTTLDELQNYIGRIDLERSRFVTDPRPLGPNRELVLMVEAEGHIVEEDARTPAFGLVMEYVEVSADSVELVVDGVATETRWRVSGFPEIDENGVIQD